MNEPSRLEELIRKYLDRTATAIEIHELDAFIHESPEAARRLAEVARLDANLIALMKGERDIARTTQVFERAASNDDEFEPIKPLPRRSWIVRHRWPALAASIFVAVGVIAVLAFGERTASLSIVQIELPPPAEELPAPLNEVLSGEALVDGKRVKTIVDGALVHAGKREPLRIKLADGSEAELTPATSAVFHGQVPGLRQFIELLEGSAKFKVEKGDAQFQVDTPRGRVTVLGTEFDLNLVKNKLIVSVLTGVVQVNVPSKPPLIVTGGEKVEFTGDGSPRKPIREMRAQFVRAEKDHLFVSAKGIAKEARFDLVPNAEIWIHGKRGKLSDVPPGAVLVLTLVPNEKTLVQSVRAEGQTQAGELRDIDVDGRSFALFWKNKDGSVKEATYSVADDCQIAIDGKAAMLNDLRIGSKVMIEKSLDGNSVVSITAGGKKVKQP